MIARPRAGRNPPSRAGRRARRAGVDGGTYQAAGREIQIEIEIAIAIEIVFDSVPAPDFDFDPDQSYTRDG